MSCIRHQSISIPLSHDCLHMALNMEVVQLAAYSAKGTNSANNGHGADRANDLNVGGQVHFGNDVVLPLWVATVLSAI